MKNNYETRCDKYRLDQTVLDICLVDQKNHHPILRPVLLCLVDNKTRTIVCTRIANKKAIETKHDFQKAVQSMIRRAPVPKFKSSETPGSDVRANLDRPKISYIKYEKEVQNVS